MEPDDVLANEVKIDGPMFVEVVVVDCYLFMQSLVFPCCPISVEEGDEETFCLDACKFSICQGIP